MSLTRTSFARRIAPHKYEPSQRTYRGRPPEHRVFYCEKFEAYLGSFVANPGAVIFGGQVAMFVFKTPFCGDPACEASVINPKDR